MPTLDDRAADDLGLYQLWYCAACALLTPGGTQVDIPWSAFETTGIGEAQQTLREFAIAHLRDEHPPHERKRS